MNGNTFTKYTQYTVKELESYVADPETCVQKLVWSDLISVLPKYLGDICEGVRICLSAKIGTYDRKVDGIILAYKNTKIQSPLSATRPNSVRVHVKIQADFYVFRPQSGSVISGIAQYVSNNYISAVIYRVFNVTIKFRTQTTRSITRGSCIKFVIKTYDMKSEIPYIEGELIGNPATSKQLPNGSTKSFNGQMAKIKTECPPTKGSDSDGEKIEEKSDVYSQQKQISTSEGKQKSKRKRVKLEKDATKSLNNGVANEQLTKDSPVDLNGNNDGDDEPQDDEIEHSIRAILSGFEQELNGTAEDDNATVLSTSSSKSAKKKKTKKAKDLASLEAEVLLKFAAECDEPNPPEVVDAPDRPTMDTTTPSKAEKVKKRKKKKKNVPEEDNFEASIMSSLLKCAAEAEDDSDERQSSPPKKSRKSVRFDNTITEASFNMFDSPEQLEISQLVSQVLSSTMNADEYE